MEQMIACVEAMKKVLGDEVGLALDCGPGWIVKDAITFARAMEPLHIAWIEDMHHRRLHALPQRRTVPGTHREHDHPHSHRGRDLPPRELQGSDREPGGQCYRPRPGRCGWDRGDEVDRGIRRSTRYPDCSPRSVRRADRPGRACPDGRRLPQNYIAFEYPIGQPEWWYDIVEGLPNPIVERGFIKVWDRPGLGVTFNVQAAKAHLADEDRHFFD